MRRVVIIPTYNERDNVEQLLPAILAQPIDNLSVMVVDDNSPDGTAEIVKQLQLKYSNIILLERAGKEGLGPAYIAAFQEALRLGFDQIAHMDGDFSHDPSVLPTLFATLEDADVVIGSRYCPGGGVANWNFFRRIISRYGNWYARTMLRLPVRDATGGFRAFRSNVLQAINLESLSSLGYNFMIEVLYYVAQLNVTIREIPITFTERREGVSKFSFAILIESFWRVAALRFRKK